MSAPTTNLRPAQLSDIPLLRKFEQGVVDAERPLSHDLKVSDVQYYDLIDLIESPQAHLLLAEQNGQPVASGFLRIDASKPHHRSDQHGYIGFIYVEPGHRGQRLAQTVIQALLAWGRDRGLSVFKLDVYSQNDAAIQAYKRLGFQANIVEMVLET